jgi:hypothetical protein
VIVVIVVIVFAIVWTHPFLHTIPRFDQHIRYIYFGNRFAIADLPFQ